MHPYDWLLVGLTCDVLGGLVLAKGFMFKRVLDAWRETRTRMGGNSYPVKSALLQKGEAVVGGTFLAVGFLLQIVGNLKGAASVNELGWIATPPRYALVLIIVSALAWGAVRLSQKWAQDRFLIYFSRRVALDKPSEPLPVTLVGAELDGLAWLYGVNRTPGETDDALRQRMDIFWDEVVRKRYARREREIPEAES